MFLPKEIDFLLKELGSYINKTQDRLDSNAVEGARRELMENKLITTVSILNKLQHLKPETEVKNKEVRILVVDDVESMRKVHRHYFMACGFRNVDLADNGMRAFTMMRKALEAGHPYDLVVSDWEMPKVSGLELLKRTRTDRDLWRTPFYLISSLSDKKLIAQCINTGATGYMVKPVNQKMIETKFKDYLN